MPLHQNVAFPTLCFVLLDRSWVIALLQLCVSCANIALVESHVGFANSTIAAGYRASLSTAP